MININPWQELVAIELIKMRMITAFLHIEVPVIKNQTQMIRKI